VSYENIKVIAHSGYRGDESPRAFFMRGERIAVVEILDMWIEEDVSDKTRRRFFIVKGNDKHKYKIYNDEKTLEWFCEMKGSPCSLNKF
jgi:hypothetical protein